VRLVQSALEVFHDDVEGHVNGTPCEGVTSSRHWVAVPRSSANRNWCGNEPQDRAFVLKVDPILCDGFGHCHELAPELVHVDEWGYPIINEQPTSSSDLASEVGQVGRTGLPRQALRIERISARPSRDVTSGSWSPGQTD